MSGDVDTPQGIVRESGIMGWIDVPLRKILADRLDRDVLIENDVRALTVGEHWFGVGARPRDNEVDQPPRLVNSRPLDRPRSKTNTSAYASAKAHTAHMVQARLLEVQGLVQHVEWAHELGEHRAHPYDEAEPPCPAVQARRPGRSDGPVDGGVADPEREHPAEDDQRILQNPWKWLQFVPRGDDFGMLAGFRDRTTTLPRLGVNRRAGGM
ncbi:hypothetical protein ABGB07_35455 [Micromonosporaceae bacterium B7E4]